MTEQEKLPKELPVSITQKLYVTTREGWASADSSSLSNEEYNQRLIQRNADQLLYDAALEEVERLGAELAKVKLEMVGFITRYCDSRMTQHTGYSGQEELARLKTVITSRYGV